MGVVEISKPGITSAIGGAKTPVNWILEATQLINALNQFGTTLSGIVNKFNPNPQDQVITSGPGAKMTKTNSPPAAAPAQAPAKQSDQDLQAFFSTPEGMVKIVEAIDQLSPLIGDVKLSEVKQLINTALGDKAGPKQDPKKPKEKKKK